MSHLTRRVKFQWLHIQFHLYNRPEVSFDLYAQERKSLPQLDIFIIRPWTMIIIVMLFYSYRLLVWNGQFLKKKKKTGRSFGEEKEKTGWSRYAEMRIKVLLKKKKKKRTRNTYIHTHNLSAWKRMQPGSVAPKLPKYFFCPLKYSFMRKGIHYLRNITVIEKEEENRKFPKENLFPLTVF